jgi:hypothetical protein
MIVLDEQLLGSELPVRIRGWYRGAIANILHLRYPQYCGPYASRLL